MTSHTLCSPMVDRCLWYYKPARETGFRNHYTCAAVVKLFLLTQLIAPRPSQFTAVFLSSIRKGDSVLCNRHEVMMPRSHDSNCCLQLWTYCLKTLFLDYNMGFNTNNHLHICVQKIKSCDWDVREEWHQLMFSWNSSRIVLHWFCIQNKIEIGRKGEKMCFHFTCTDLFMANHEQE